MWDGYGRRQLSTVSGPLSYKRHLVVESVASEGLFVLSEAGESVFRGPVFVHVADLVDGQRSDDDIVRALAGRFPAAQVYFALASLRRAGVLDDLSLGLPDRATAFWHAIGATPSPAVFRLVTFGDVEGQLFETRLRELGLEFDDQAPRALVLTDDYLRRGLDEFDDMARREGMTYLLCKPLGLVPWIGPTFMADQPGCLACLGQRLHGHRRVQSFLQRHVGRAEPYATAIAALPATIDAVVGLLAAQLQLWCSSVDSPALERTVVSLELPSLTSTHHVLTARPQCPRCGDPGLVARRMSIPIVLSPIAATRRDGGSRRDDAHTTYARLEHHISPITGIVSRMVRSTVEGSTAAHSYFTDHNFVHMTDNLEFLRISLRSHSGGKGRSDMQARTSALCESIERYSGLRQYDEAVRVASFAELGEAAVHPNAIMCFSDKQLREREAWNRRGELFCWVPERFDEHAQIEWTPAWVPGDDTPRWIATSLCFYAADSPWMRADSNGAAAGSTVEEAIVQGFMELVERDAVALWWYNRLCLPAVDLASFDEPDFLRSQAELAARGRELWVLELPTDLGIPCHVAVSRRVDQPGEELVFGFGAHFDAALSISRAITELHQFLPHVGADSHPPTTIPGRWYREASVATEPYLWPDERAPLRRRGDSSPPPSEHLRDTILRCQALVRARGLELMVQDHTRPDTGLCVVKVFVPGLRHFWARLGPGRLYDVPVALGLLDAARDEAQLNPIAMFV